MKKKNETTFSIATVPSYLINAREKKCQPLNWLRWINYARSIENNTEEIAEQKMRRKKVTLFAIVSDNNIKFTLPYAIDIGCNEYSNLLLLLPLFSREKKKLE